MTESPLKLLHSEDALSRAKMDEYSKLSTQELLESLRPGQAGSLKARPDGTVLDGHHRLRILRDRGVVIDALPREVIPRN